MVKFLFVAILLASSPSELSGSRIKRSLVSSASELSGSRIKRSAKIEKDVAAKTEKDIAVLDTNVTMLNTDPTPGLHITCPVLNALVHNGDMKPNGDNVDADTVVNSLMRAGLNQPSYSGEPLAPGITQSNAFEYTFGIFLKNKAANYRDDQGSLTLPIYNLAGSNHEHNSHTGITTKKSIAFDEIQWKKLAEQADRNEGKCFSRDAWAHALLSFQKKDYHGKDIDDIVTNEVRSGHAIRDKAGTWGASWLVNKLLKKGADNGNALFGKRLVAGISQVMNGMINLYWTGDYGNLELYTKRAEQLESEDGKGGLSFPWLDEDFCLPVNELRELLEDGTYPSSSGYSPMTEQEFMATGKVFKFSKSRCTAAYFLPGGKGYVADDACVEGKPPLVDKDSRAKLTALHVLFGK